MHRKIKISYNSVNNYIAQNDFKGWDPYDGLTTKCGCFKKYYHNRLLFFYLIKFSPLNLRQIFKISKRAFTQPYMILGLSYLAMELYDEAENMLGKVLKDSKYNELGYHCWDGLDMPIQMLGSYKKKGVPNVISTELAGRFIIEYQLKHKKNDHTEILTSIKRYFCEKMLVTYNKHWHFRYYNSTPAENFVFNANANVCALLADLDAYSNNIYNKDLVYDVIYSIIDFQKSDGRWNYAVNLKTNKQKLQVDFHQGFILDSILRVIKAYGSDEKLEKAYSKGLDFYFNKQFLPNGQSIYRYPKKWPVNIHNQVQGIQTFTRATLAGYGEKYLQFAKIIANWTIDNMQDMDGHFYYMKYPLFTNKIPYIRWSDASMAYALSVLLNALKKNK